MKISVTVSKTVQERQYEPTSVSVSHEAEVGTVSMDEADAMTSTTYHRLSNLVDQLLFERTGRKVRRA